MRPEPTTTLTTAPRALVLVVSAMMIATVAQAQAQGPDQGRWRLGASTGGYAPRSAVIKSADGSNTRLGAAPSFALDLQYLATKSVSLYASGAMTFSTITLGSAIQPAVIGPSNQVLLGAGTAGLVLAIPASDWLGEHLQPTVRVGGGFKWYSFDLSGAMNQWRPTADIGLGFRGVGSGPIELTAEVRYLPSSFDQSRLPIRGIAPQDQRQNDLLFAIGIGIRP